MYICTTIPKTKNGLQIAHWIDYIITDNGSILVIHVQDEDHRLTE